MTDRPAPPPPNYPPTQCEPEPTPAPTADADRLPRWWEPKPRLTTPTEPEPEDDPEPEAEPDDQDPDQDNEPAELGPIERANAPTARKTLRNRVQAHADDRSLRVIAFNAAAAAIGYSAGLDAVFGQWLPAAEHAATGMAGLALAAAGGLGAWRLTGHPAVNVLLPRPPVSRTLITLGAAELGRRWAPVPVAWINQHGTAWGLGANAVSLLLTSAGMCGGLYWLIDRRARDRHWAIRLLARIPLASALLATALYAPGPVS